MEIADIRKMPKVDAEAKKKKLLAEPVKITEVAELPPGAMPLPYKVEVIYCASCKYWERDSAKAVFATCGLSRHHGLAVGITRTDTDRCSLAEAR